MIPDPQRVLRDAARLSALLAGIGGLAAWFLLDPGIALGVLLGAAVGWINLWLLARALHQSVASAEQYRGRKWAIPGALLLKWPLLLLVIAGLALYTPARAEGLAAGYAIALFAATLAAMRGQQQPPRSS